MPLFGLFGPPDVEKLKAKGDVKGLIKALNYKKDVQIDWRKTSFQDRAKYEGYVAVRRAAAEALGQIGDAQAMEPLLVALKDESGVRQAAALALGQIRDTRAIELLVATLIDPEHNVRRATIEALGQIDQNWMKSNAAQEAIPTFVAKLKEARYPHLVLERRVIEALELIDPDWVKKSPEARKAAITVFVALLKDEDISTRKAAITALVQIDPPVVKPLIAVLSDHNQEVRNIAKERLVQIGLPAVKPLITALKDVSVHVEAAFILGEIGSTQAVEPLIALLGMDGHWIAQGAAAKVLGKLQDKRAIETLLTTLKHENEDVRQAAVWALGQIDSNWMKSEAAKRATPTLIVGLTDQDSSVQQAARVALEQIDPDWQKSESAKAAIPELVMVLKDKDANRRKKAAQTLDSLGWQPVDDTQRVLHAIAHQKLEMAVKLGGAAMEPLMTALKDSDRSVRQAAASALGQLGTQLKDATFRLQIIESLVAALDHGNVQEEAVEALARIGDTCAVTPLIRLATIDSKSETAAKALQKLLERAAASIASKDLQAITQVEDRKWSSWISGGTDICGIERGEYYQHVVNYSHVRQLARQELIRRGLNA